MLEALARELKRARDRRGLSLQAVAEPADISAPYLQKLERGEVTTPSPHVLARLAHVLGLPYLRLMELAGYLDEAERAAARQRAPKPHPLADEQLSAEEWRAVKTFIQDLKARRRRPETRARAAKRARNDDS